MSVNDRMLALSAPLAPTASRCLCIAACYHGDDLGRAIHLLGALAGKVIRVSPPLVMPLAEAEEYLGVMYRLFASVG